MMQPDNNLNDFSRIPLLLKIVIMVVLSLVSLRGEAQSNNYKAVANVTAFKQEFALQSAKVNTVMSNFSQVKRLEALEEEITSTGSFWFKRENKIRIEYLKPFRYKMIMNNDRVLLSDDQKESKMNVKSNRLFQQVNRILMDCLQGRVLDSKDFTSKVFENEKNFRLELAPVSKSLRELFTSIVLVVDKQDYTVNSLQMNEEGQDFTLLTFTGKKINQAIDEAVFAF